jgi:hypothetical protein
MRPLQGAIALVAWLTLPLALACGAKSKSNDVSGGGDGGSTSGASSGGNVSGGTSSGGSASGGATSTAGHTTAGSSSGGAAGGGGGESSSGGDASEPVTGGAECATDEDCKLFDDCCRCTARASDDSPGACNVTCKSVPPQCDAGLVPSVVGACWGPCVPPEECTAVSNCDDCLANQLCIKNDFSPFVQCVAVAPECAQKPTCECANACDQQCSDADGSIGCYCIAC